MKIQEITQAEIEATTSNVLVAPKMRVATNVGPRGNATNRSIWINTETGKTTSFNPKSIVDITAKTIYKITLTEE